MILAGTNITTTGELLKKIPVDYLYHSLRNPKPEIVAQIRQLRGVRDLDANQYSLQKKRLPYFVCGIFNPPCRRTENFAYIEYFVLDIDHISQKGLVIDDVKKKITQDSRVRMCFVSPGEDGLKVLFKLSERCFDAKIYSLFYKAFVTHFSILYNLEQVLDKCTSDVSRACFISIDSEVYYQKDSENVNIKAFLPVDSPVEMFKIKNESTSDFINQRGPDLSKIEKGPLDPDQAAMGRIKEILNPKLKIQKESTPVFVPQQLDDIMEALVKYAENLGLTITDIHNIQYGKKLKFQLGIKLAEINLFYGKRGFSVVISPRCGTSVELNDIAAKTIECFLNEYQMTN